MRVNNDYCTKPTIVFVGAKSSNDPKQHPGGQLTASLGLTEYASNHDGFHLEIIDTTQSSFPIPSFWIRLKKGIKRCFQLMAILNSRNVKGVIIFTSSGFSFYERVLLAALARIRGVKTMLFIRSGHFIDEVKRNYIKLIISRFLLKVPSLIGAQGESWERFYIELGVSGSKIRIIRNWLPLNYFLEKKPKSLTDSAVVRFVFVGCLTEKKGILELLNAALILSKDYVFELTVVGGGTLEHEALTFIQRNSLTALVTLTGWQKPEQVMSILKKSDVFVLPSKAEGFPNAMLEAMAQGLPTIVSDVGSVADSLLHGESGFLLSKVTAESIAQEMRKYILDKTLITTHSIKSIDIVEKNHGYELNCKAMFSDFDI